MKLLSVTPNPCLDLALFVEKLLIGDTNRVVRTEVDAGGKGINSSRVFCHLGGESAATGFVGGKAGHFIKSVIAREKIVDLMVKIAGETRTNYSIEDDDGNPPTTLNSKGPAISLEEYELLKRQVREHSVGYQWTLIAGSLPPEVPVHAFYEIGEIARKAGSKIAVDGDGPVQAEAIKLQPDLVKPNAAEAARLLGVKVEDTEQAIKASQKLYDLIGGGERYALISRGKDGAVLTCATGSFIGKSPKVEAKSTIGSGDSMIAGFLFGLHQGLGAEECLAWGLAAGAATALTDGSAIGDGATTRRLLPEAKVTLS